MKKHILFCAIVSALFFIPGAYGEDLKFSPIDFEVFATASNGYLVGQFNSTALPELRAPNGTISQVGSYVYKPVGINTGGDVVGFSHVGDYEDALDVAFFTPLGKESQILLQGNDIVGASINAHQRIVVVQRDKVSIFQGTTLVKEVSTVPLREFTSVYDVLADNRALITISDAGTPRYGVISAAGEFTQVSEAALPFAANFWALQTNDRILFSVDDKIFDTDLISPAVDLHLSIPKGTSILAASGDGSFLLSTDNDNGVGLWRPSQDASVHGLDCALPRKTREKGYISSSVLFPNKDILVTYFDSSYSVVTLPAGVPPNYCATMRLTVDPACATHFMGDKTGDLTLKKAFTTRTTCQVTATVRAGKKPIANALVVTGSGEAIRRGRTGRSGMLTFPLHFDDKSAQIYVTAPYKDAHYQSTQRQISNY